MCVTILVAYSVMSCDFDCYVNYHVIVNASIHETMDIDLEKSACKIYCIW